MRTEQPKSNLEILRSNQQAIPQLIDRKRGLITTYQRNAGELAQQLEKTEQSQGVIPGLKDLIAVGLQRRIEGRQNGIQVIAASIQRLEAEFAETATAVDLGDRGYIRAEINALQTKIKQRRLPEQHQPEQEQQEPQPTINELIEQALFDQQIIEQRSLKVRANKASPVRTLLKQLLKEPKTPDMVDAELAAMHREYSTRGRKVIAPLKRKLIPIGLNIHSTYDKTGHVLQYRVGVLPTQEEAQAVSAYLKAQKQQLREAVASATTYEEAIEIVYKSLNKEDEQLGKSILLIAGWWGEYAYRATNLEPNTTPSHKPNNISEAVYSLGSIINPHTERGSTD